MKEGKCSFCQTQRIYIPSEVRSGGWACPFIEGSGLHFCLPRFFTTDDEGVIHFEPEKDEQWKREKRFGKTPFTLKEYRSAVKNWS